MQTKTRRQAQQEQKLSASVQQAKRDKADLKAMPGKKQPRKQAPPAGVLASLKAKFFGRADAPQSVQQSIPYKEILRDGICRVNGKRYTKTVTFTDITYQLAQNEDKTHIFENWCDFLNCATRSYTNTIPLTKSLRALDHVVLKIGGFQ